MILLNLFVIGLKLIPLYTFIRSIIIFLIHGENPCPRPKPFYSS